MKTEQIVTRRRGGFCYELNGLFAWLLRQLGFDVTMLAAEVMNAKGEYGLPFDHMTLMVTLDTPWLADVGFGDSFVEPLPSRRGSKMRRAIAAIESRRWATGSCCCSVSARATGERTTGSI